MEKPLVAWVRSALRAAEIVEAVGHRREGIAAACEALGVGPTMVKRQLDLLDYVKQHGPLENIRVAQTRLELFRSVERADPVRGSKLREAVLADHISLRQLQIELDEAKIRQGLREPVVINLEEVLGLCLKEIPGLDLLTPPVDTTQPQLDGLWIGADLDWTLSEPEGKNVPTWCAMISINVAAARNKRGSFFEFIHRVGLAGLRYQAVSVILASEHERRTLATPLEWITKRVSTVFWLHVIGSDAKVIRVGHRRDPLADAVRACAGLSSDAGKA